MKKILLTGAALMLGTSAHAWTNAQEDAHQNAAAGWQASADKTDGDGLSWAGTDMKSKETVGGVSATAAAGTGFEKASNTSWSGGAKDMANSDGMTWADADMKSKDMVGGVAMASAQSWSGAKSATDGGLTWAEADIKSKASVGGVAMADAAMGANSGANMGQGGPLEPRGYPACRPGRGDDNCIQLYERGVQADLAAWKATDGPAMGMGGPLEPAAGTKADAPSPASSSGAKVADEGDEAEMAAAADAPKGAADPHAGHDMNGTKAATPSPN
ncbi:MAG TPA: hypothetical protein VF552_05490 [Allosphingosinicella sp.]|jgi:hypothetical protein